MNPMLEQSAMMQTSNNPFKPMPEKVEASLDRRVDALETQVAALMCTNLALQQRCTALEAAAEPLLANAQARNVQRTQGAGSSVAQQDRRHNEAPSREAYEAYGQKALPLGKVQVGPMGLRLGASMTITNVSNKDLQISGETLSPYGTVEVCGRCHQRMTPQHSCPPSEC